MSGFSGPSEGPLGLCGEDSRPYRDVLDDDGRGVDDGGGVDYDYDYNDYADFLWQRLQEETGLGPVVVVSGLGDEDPSFTRGGKTLILVDSGSGVTCCPPQHGAWFPLVPSETTLRARTATGGSVRHYGSRTVEYDFESGHSGSVVYQVMDVTRPVLSVGKLCEGGHTTILGPKVAEIRIGERRLQLERENGVSYLKGWYQKPQEEVPIFVPAVPPCLIPPRQRWFRVPLRGRPW